MFSAQQTNSPRLRPATLLVLCLVAPVASGCDADGREGAALPVVAVSVPPQAYFVERLAGDSVRVEVMLPPGGNPHVHEPTFQQVRALAEAAVYVKVGHPKFAFEGAWLDRLLADNRGLRVVDCSAGIDAGVDDPHVWLSPRLVRAMLPRIAAAIAGAVPGRAADVDDRLATLLAEVDRLDAEIREQLSGLSSRRFYVMHAALGHFARDYGLQQVAVESGSREPDPRQLAELVARAKQDRVRVLFGQPQFAPRHAQVIAAEIGARLVDVDPLARDWVTNLRTLTAALREALA
jgi:zinc transport system substrate-binding protein